MCCKCKGKSLKQGNERICLLFPRRQGVGVGRGRLMVESGLSKDRESRGESGSYGRS